MIVVPEDFAVSTIRREGAAGRLWIDVLPRVVEALCAEWGLTVVGSAMHGYLGLVLPVIRGAETCVLKVSWIGEAVTGEMAALRVWGGRGAVQLLASAPAQGAMLLERLDHTRSLDNLGIEEALSIAGRLHRRLAVEAPPGLRQLRTWARDLALSLPDRWAKYGKHMPRRLLDRTAGLASELGEACIGNLLINYDLHYANVLAGTREPWLVIDPMVVVGVPEFGIAQLLWRRLEDIQASGGLDHHFTVLTEAAELDAGIARSWALLRCVDYWLWGVSVGLTYDPARCEIITDWLVQNRG